MSNIEEEKDFIILSSIIRHGYVAMPQDYSFLVRHSLLQFYYEMLNRKTSGRNTRELENLIKRELETSLGKCDLSCLRAYREQNGNKATKLLFNNNEIYWKILLAELKKRSGNEHDKTDTENPTLA